MNKLIKENVNELKNLDNVEWILVYDRGASLPRKATKELFFTASTTRDIIDVDTLRPRTSGGSMTIGEAGASVSILGDLYNNSGDTIVKNVVASGSVKTSTDKFPIGYNLGSGDTVTQLTSLTTPVTINFVTGSINTVSSTLAASSYAKFTVNNSRISSADVVIVNVYSYSGTGRPVAHAVEIGDGQFDILIHNIDTASALSDVIKLSYAIIAGDR